MIRVIGEAPEELKRCTCRSCAAKLEYSKWEVNKWSGKDYSGGSAGVEYINCPRCGERVVLRAW
jgi:hypothetical protein